MNQTSNNSILLIGINAKYIHSNPAIYSLKAYADKYYPDRPGGCAVEIAEYTINQPQGAILADIYQKRPQAAAFSCYIWNIRYVLESMDRNTTLIGNIRAYLLSALFNSPATIGQFYASLVGHEMAQARGRGG